MTPPTILFIPGFWEGSAPFAQVRSLLEAHGFPTEVAPLISTGKSSPGNPSMLDDIAAVRTTVSKLIENRREVVMVMHSGGGFIGSNAIEGLGAKGRGEGRGGVIKLVYLTAALFPEGFTHRPLPFMEFDVSFISLSFSANFVVPKDDGRTFVEAEGPIKRASLAEYAEIVLFRERRCIASPPKPYSSMT